MTHDAPATGILAEFESSGALLAAAKRVHEAGYEAFDCHSPFPIHGMDDAMGMKRSPLGWVVGLMAAAGVLGAIGLQWWTSSVDYKFVISGKPFFSFQAYVPITFGLGVLFSAFAAVFGMFHFNRLPRLNHPVFTSERFKKFSTDGFFVSIEASDAKFSPQETEAFLKTIGATHVELLEP
jgi:uncharacterized membrane protein (DUF2068 family)